MVVILAYIIHQEYDDIWKISFIVDLFKCEKDAVTAADQFITSHGGIIISELMVSMI